jgi:hypothetical protein
MGIVDLKDITMYLLRSHVGHPLDLAPHNPIAHPPLRRPHHDYLLLLDLDLHAPRKALIEQRGPATSDIRLHSGQPACPELTATVGPASAEMQLALPQNWETAQRQVVRNDEAYTACRAT